METGETVESAESGQVPAPEYSKSQRLVNLVICLQSTTVPLSADRIRSTVQGYETCPTETAFLRMFERDKNELRRAGVPIEQGTADAPGSPIGYRIRPDDYGLPELHLTPEQVGLLGIAAQMWDRGRRHAEAGGALAKLSAAGLSAPEVPGVEVAPPPELGVAAILTEAVAADRVVRFEHTAAGADSPSTRTLEPWWVGSRDGRWYLAGLDLDRKEPRTFRLSRLGPVTVSQTPRSARIPDPGVVARLVDEAVGRFNPVVEARVLVRVGHGSELRARAAGPARTGDGDELQVRGPLADLAALVAASAGTAVVLDPPELVDRVHAILDRAVRDGAEGTHG